MKIKCTVQELGELIRKCSELTCGNCILYNMCEGSGIEGNVHYEDILPDDE
ncbi:MAG: hypothetical protein J6V25_02035 [Oscillospiraceae bacterium]|nr:hypothetical protein [Oscillospiraceae bacterium]